MERDALARYVPACSMAIGAHPDDIELGAGGTLSAWSQQGGRIVLVVCTDGAAGSAEREITSPELAARRHREQHNAAGVLGTAEVVMLGLPDGQLEDTPELRRSLVKLLRTYRPTIVLSHDHAARREFVHRDHRVVGQAVLDAIYPFARDHLHFPELLSEGLEPHRVDRCWMWDADESDVIMDISSTIDTKIEALSRHVSQLDGVTVGQSPAACLMERGRRDAHESRFEYGEAFRELVAPP